MFCCILLFSSSFDVRFIDTPRSICSTCTNARPKVTDVHLLATYEIVNAEDRISATEGLAAQLDPSHSGRHKAFGNWKRVESAGGVMGSSLGTTLVECAAVDTIIIDLGEAAIQSIDFSLMDGRTSMTNKQINPA